MIIFLNFTLCSNHVHSIKHYYKQKYSSILRKECFSAKVSDTYFSVAIILSHIPCPATFGPNLWDMFHQFNVCLCIVYTVYACCVSSWFILFQSCSSSKNKTLFEHLQGIAKGHQQAFKPPFLINLQKQQQHPISNKIRGHN